MNKLQPLHRWLAVVVLAGTLAACAGETTAPSNAADPSAFAIRNPGGGTSGSCDNGFSERICQVPPTAPSAATGRASLAIANLSTVAATLRVRCEARRNSRSKISVDGNNVLPRNGTFRARVRAAGGAVTSPARRAVGDEVEFDFDSDRGDIAAGATRIPARFIVARSGPDVVGELLNAQGRVVASQGAECRIR